MNLDTFINWSLLKEPFNWAIVGGMIFFIALIAHLLLGSPVPSFS